MENGQKTIFDLFNGDKKFIIPKYQRAYSWGTKQLKDFVNDIENQGKNKDYFLGTILFQNNPRTSGYEEIQIVDGQQRITTLIIFVKVLLKFLQGKDPDADYSKDMRRYIKESEFYKLELAPMDNEFFRTYIIDDHQLDDSYITTPSQKRLKAAKDFFLSKLSNYDADILKQFKKKTENTKILTYSVNDTAEATLIFETTNDRGKSLTNLEKSKSFLMHKIYLITEHPDELLSTIQDRFSEIYRILEEMDSEENEEDSFLQYHFISHFDWKYTQKNKDYQVYMDKIKDYINKMVINKDSNSVLDFIDKYSRELKETFFVVKLIRDDKEKAIRDLYLLERLSLFLPLLIKCYKLDNHPKKREFYKIAELLEIFSFRVLGIGRKPAYTGRDWFYVRARDFSGDFEKLQSEIARKIIEYQNDGSFIRQLTDPLFFEVIDGLNIKYLFWKYENFLRQNEQPIVSPMSEDEFSTYNPKLKLTIEHIACQTPKVTTSNLELVEITDDFRKRLLHSIGNLTFDPNSSNASKNNNQIEFKNTKYFVRAPFKTQNELNDFIKNEKWTEESISERTKKLVDFCTSYWNPSRVEGIKQVSEKEIEEDQEYSPFAIEHKKIMKDVERELNSQIKNWPFPLSSPSSRCKFHQTDNGTVTYVEVYWSYHDSDLGLWFQIGKEERDVPYQGYINIFSDKKSEMLRYKMNQPDIRNLFDQYEFEDESSTNNKPEFLKSLLSKQISSEIFINEFNPVKEILLKILAD